MALTRATGAGAGFGWLWNTIALIRRHPRQLLGGAAWIGGAMLVIVIAWTLLSLGLQMVLRPSPTGAMVLGLLTMLPLFYVVAALFAGYLRMLDKVQAGQSPSPAEVFAVLGEFSTGLRIFGFLLAMVVLTDLLIAILVVTLAPDVGNWYVQTMGSAFQQAGTSAPPPTLPSNFGLIFATIFVLNLFSFSVQAIGFGQVAVNGRSVPGAVADGVVGTARNLLPLLVLLLAAIGLAILVFLGLALVVGAFTLLAKFVSPWLMILFLPLYLLLLVIMIAVMYGVMYHLWRDICGPARETPAMAA